MRIDPATEGALATLTADGTTRSDAVRRAVVAAAAELDRRRLQAEAESLRDDPEDLAEVRRVQAEMESLRAW